MVSLMRFKSVLWAEKTHDGIIVRFREGSRKFDTVKEARNYIREKEKCDLKK